MVYVLFEGLTNVILLVKTSDMASLLREQTRIKESLEGALERQKEGMHTIYQENYESWKYFRRGGAVQTM